MIHVGAQVRERKKRYCNLRPKDYFSQTNNEGSSPLSTAVNLVSILYFLQFKRFIETRTNYEQFEAEVAKKFSRNLER